MTVADEPHEIEWVRLLHLRYGLRMEVIGLKGRGRSAYSRAKEELGITGNKQRVLDQVHEIIQSIKQQQKGEA